MDHWKVLDEEVVYSADPFVRVTRQQIATDSGKQVSNYYQVILPDFVIAVALASDNRVLTIWQYKHGSRKYGLTFPAGEIAQGEDPIAAMHRELLEETGYLAKGPVEFLGRYATHGNQQCGHGYLYIMTGCESVAEPAPGDLETMTVRLMTIQEVDEALSAGAITVLPHVSVWALVRARLPA